MRNGGIKTVRAEVHFFERGEGRAQLALLYRYYGKELLIGTIVVTKM